MNRRNAERLATAGWVLGVTVAVAAIWMLVTDTTRWANVVLLPFLFASVALSLLGSYWRSHAGPTEPVDRDAS